MGGGFRVAQSDLQTGAVLAVGMMPLLHVFVIMIYYLVCFFFDLMGQDLEIVGHFVSVVSKPTLSPLLSALPWG